MIKKSEVDKHGLYFLSKSDIEFEIEEQLKGYYPELLKTPMALDIEDFTENHLGLNLEYHKLSLDEKYYGAFTFSDGLVNTYDGNTLKKLYFKEKTVIIDPLIIKTGDHLHRFTMGHEASHFIFQYDVCRKNSIVEEKSTSLLSMSYYSHKEKRALITKEDWAEWQANYGSACLLMNRTAALLLVSRLLHKEVKYKDGFFSRVGDLSKLYLRHEFVKTFNVSDEAAWIRLQELSD